MKRLFALMMAMALVLSLGVDAFAAGETGSITITNATADQEYAPYKIFDALISGTGGFTYSVTEDNQFFDDLFLKDTDNDPATPPVFVENDYFTYNPADGSVTKKDVADADVVEYLRLLVYNKVQTGTDTHGNPVYEYQPKTDLTPAADPQKDTDGNKEVKFEGLDYGYYLITSTLGTMVTINSTDPDVKVIDKNQLPGDNFTKLVYDEDSNTWVTDSTANIGDIVDFKIDFHATNYNGEKQVKYYVVSDIKGDALWAEFNSITVTINGKTLDRGYYHGLPGTFKTDEWEFFGKWTEEEEGNHNNAQWFMIHKGFDEFDIVIPWMDDYTFTGTETGFELEFGDEASSIYASSSNVTVAYKASVEPGAGIAGTKDNLYNKANLSWMDTELIDPPGEAETDLIVHALGVTKTDGATGALLAGATFEIYRDEACIDPLYVIPTDVKGVYMVDDLNTSVSGTKRESARKTYEAYLAEYLQGATQKNEVVTQLNGKLVVLGLEAGTYYLKETKAPDGYNKMVAPVTVVVPDAAKTTTFSFDIDKDGNVVKTEDKVETKTYEKVVNAPVTNNKGAQLPSTGGEGTIKMITIGTAVAIAFAVLLITQKKMTAYQD